MTDPRLRVVPEQETEDFADMVGVDVDTADVAAAIALIVAASLVAFGAGVLIGMYLL